MLFVYSAVSTFQGVRSVMDAGYFVYSYRKYSMLNTRDTAFILDLFISLRNSLDFKN